MSVTKSSLRLTLRAYSLLSDEADVVQKDLVRVGVLALETVVQEAAFDVAVGRASGRRVGVVGLSVSR